MSILTDDASSLYQLASQTPTLLVVQGLEQGMRYDLTDGVQTLGRGSQSSIRIRDTEVSRLHAAILHTPEGFVLTDRQSSNGTIVNGIPITTHRLRTGDQILLGHTLLLFSDAPAPSPAVRLAGRVNFVSKHDAHDQAAIVGQIASEGTGDGAATSSVNAGQAIANLQALYRISEEAVRGSLDLPQLLQRILDLTMEVVQADRGCILLSDPETQAVQPQALAFRKATSSDERMPVSRSIVDYVLKTNQGVRTSDAQHDSRFDPARSILQAGIRQAMCVPMPGRQELMGVLYVDRTTSIHALVQSEPNQQFDEDQLRLLVAIGRQAAMAVENNRYQQAFVKAERLAAMGQTIAVLSHHIKNILQGVKGGGYLIDLGLGDGDQALIRKGWGIVEKNQNKIYQLVMDMLTFSKERKPLLERADLNEVLADVDELMQSRAGECGVTLEYHPGKDLPEATFDREGIHRAVLNIVTNAIDATEGGEHPIVKLESGWSADSGLIWVSVADNGPGIPDEHLSKMFNVFESTKGARGTGLGLPVSQKIIREHGGEITVETKVGKGTRFLLAWPLVDEDHAVASGSRTIV